MTPRPRKPPATTFPLRIVVSPQTPEQLAQCEEGSYEDQMAMPAAKRDRPLHTHTYHVAMRYSSKIVLESVQEAEDMYYAVCSGTFQLRYLRAARKIADILRPVVQPYNPDLVRQWPQPDGL